MTEFLNWVTPGISLVAWTFFLFDRHNMKSRIDKHSIEIDRLTKESTENKAALYANSEADKLRQQLLNQSLDHLKEGFANMNLDFKEQRAESKQLQLMLMEFLFKDKAKNGEK